MTKFKTLYRAHFVRRKNLRNPILNTTVDLAAVLGNHAEVWFTAARFSRISSTPGPSTPHKTKTPKAMARKVRQAAAMARKIGLKSAKQVRKFANTSIQREEMVASISCFSYTRFFCPPPPFPQLLRTMASCSGCGGKKLYDDCLCPRNKVV